MFCPYTLTLASEIQNKVLYLLTKNMKEDYPLMLPKGNFTQRLASILNN